MSGHNSHEQIVGFMARARWHDEAIEGEERTRLLYELGVFLSEERMQMFVEYLNAQEERLFGSDALFFYDYCSYCALTNEVPF